MSEHFETDRVEIARTAADKITISIPLKGYDTPVVITLNERDAIKVADGLFQVVTGLGGD